MTTTLQQRSRTLERSTRVSQAVKEGAQSWKKLLPASSNLWFSIWRPSCWLGASGIGEGGGVEEDDCERATWGGRV